MIDRLSIFISDAVGPTVLDDEFYGIDNIIMIIVIVVIIISIFIIIKGQIKKMK